MSQDYESSVAKRFALAVEQLEQCAELIEDGGIPKLRMAVVLTDNLADTFLFRLCLSHIARADQNTMDLTTKLRISKRELEDLRNFDAKLRFVRNNVAPEGEVGSRLTATDAEVFRIGHRYRNAIYHRDSHNPVVVPVLARLFFRATCRLFQTVNPSGWGQSSQSTQRDLASLSTYEVLDDKGMFWPFKAAGKVADALQRRITVDLQDARATLSADLRARSQDLNQLIEKLPADRSGVQLGIAWTEFWHIHGYDDSLVELSNRADLWLRRDEFPANAKNALVDVKEAQEQLDAASQQMFSTFRAKVSLDAIPRAAIVAERLMKAKDSATALRAYHEADRHLGDLEELLWYMEEQVDRAMDLESERRSES